MNEPTPEMLPTLADKPGLKVRGCVETCGLKHWLQTLPGPRGECEGLKWLF